MGFFSWMFCDTNNKERLKIGKSAYLLTPKDSLYEGRNIHESSYDGYGSFYIFDVYEVVADLNREYLSKHPDHLIYQNDRLRLKPEQKKNGRKVSSFKWYKYYSNLSLSHREIEENMKRDGLRHDYRDIGIEIACYDYDNAHLPYPIKIASKDVPYESVKASRSDSMQGCD